MTRHEPRNTVVDVPVTTGPEVEPALNKLVDFCERRL